jgi:hypothetical protein
MTLQEILNSPLMNQIIEEDNAELKSSGWSVEDVKEMARYISKKTR